MAMTRKEKSIIRHRVFIRSDERCEECHRFIIEEPGEWSSMHLHHRKSRGAGGGWELDNLQALCIACHLISAHNPKSVPKKETIN
jgi:5-methylcytosine-specific restriction endonuclease McrA